MVAKVFGLVVTALILAGMWVRWRWQGGTGTIYGRLAALCLLFLSVVLVAFAFQNVFAI